MLTLEQHLSVTAASSNNSSSELLNFMRWSSGCTTDYRCGVAGAYGIPPTIPSLIQLSGNPVASRLGEKYGRLGGSAKSDKFQRPHTLSVKRGRGGGELRSHGYQKGWTQGARENKTMQSRARLPRIRVLPGRAIATRESTEMLQNTTHLETSPKVDETHPLHNYVESYALSRARSNAFNSSCRGNSRHKAFETNSLTVASSYLGYGLSLGVYSTSSMVAAAGSLHTRSGAGDIGSEGWRSASGEYIPIAENQSEGETAWYSRQAFRGDDSVRVHKMRESGRSQIMEIQVINLTSTSKRGMV
ncbi:hypothetical protein FB451DRAFT_1188271 [Mycena latifolia]|nr:hypothetical protein FB451DRAFT_1188271 [Mycena latifolia]